METLRTSVARRRTTRHGSTFLAEFRLRRARDTVAIDDWIGTRWRLAHWSCSLSIERLDESVQHRLSRPYQSTRLACERPHSRSALLGNERAFGGDEREDASERPRVEDLGRCNPSAARLPDRILDVGEMVHRVRVAIE